MPLDHTATGTMHHQEEGEIEDALLPFLQYDTFLNCCSLQVMEDDMFAGMIRCLFECRGCGDTFDEEGRAREHVRRMHAQDTTATEGKAPIPSPSRPQKRRRDDESPG